MQPMFNKTCACQKHRFFVRMHCSKYLWNFVSTSMYSSVLVPDMLLLREMLRSFILKYNTPLLHPKISPSTNFLLMTCNGICCIHWQFVPPQTLNHNNMQASKLYDTTSATHTGNDHPIHVGKFWIIYVILCICWENMTLCTFYGKHYVTHSFSYVV